MTAVITTPDLLTAQTGIRVGWLAVEGERPHFKAPHPRSVVRDADVQGRLDDLAVELWKAEPLGPPAWLVKAASVCETCDGSGRYETGEGEHARNDPCPDCHGLGKPRIEVRAEDWITGQKRLPYRGSIHVGWVTVNAVVPVVGRCIDACRIRHACHQSSYGVLFHTPLSDPDPDGETERDITADVAHLGSPVDLIGKYLVHLDTATTTGVNNTP